MGETDGRLAGRLAEPQLGALPGDMSGMSDAAKCPERENSEDLARLRASPRLFKNQAEPSPGPEIPKCVNAQCLKPKRAGFVDFFRPFPHHGFP